MGDLFVRLTPKGKAVVEFFKFDAAKLGITEAQAYEVARELSRKFDGTRSMVELFNDRYEVVDGQVVDKWPDVVG